MFSESVASRRRLRRWSSASHSRLFAVPLHGTLHVYMSKCRTPRISYSTDRSSSITTRRSIIRRKLDLTSRRVLVDPPPVRKASFPERRFFVAIPPVKRQITRALVHCEKRGRSDHLFCIYWKSRVPVVAPPAQRLRADTQPDSGLSGAASALLQEAIHLLHAFSAPPPQSRKSASDPVALCPAGK